MIELTDQQKADIVAAAVEQIKANAVERATNQVIHTVNNAVYSVVDEHVTAFLKAEIIPAVQAELLVRKPVLVEAAVAAAGEMADVLRARMVEALAKNLSSDYKARDLYKAMFGF